MTVEQLNPTFSTLAYLLISISFLPFSSVATVEVASKAILQARSDLEYKNSIIISIHVGNKYTFKGGHCPENVFQLLLLGPTHRS